MSRQWRDLGFLFLSACFTTLMGMGYFATGRMFHIGMVALLWLAVTVFLLMTYLERWR